MVVIELFKSLQAHLSLTNLSYTSFHWSARVHKLHSDNGVGVVYRIGQNLVKKIVNTSFLNMQKRILCIFIFGKHLRGHGHCPKKHALYKWYHFGEIA